MNLRRLLLVTAIPASIHAGCSSGSTTDPQPVDAGDGSGDAVDPGLDASDGSSADVGDDADAGPVTCFDGLDPVPFPTGTTGVHRWDYAADFTVPIHGGGEVNLASIWTGCDTYIFIPDTIPRSDVDAEPIWQADIDLLIDQSPPNAHYFFVSRKSQSVAAQASISAVDDAINAALDNLGAGDADYWAERLHVVDVNAQGLDAWIGDVIATGHGQVGMSIDRFGRVRGMGSFADVTRFRADIQSLGGWPWESNVAYATHEVRRFNYEALRQRELDAQNATVVDLFTGQTIEMFADVEVALPSAADMERFDRLEIDVTQMCPNPDAPEFGNCGAWDYLAYLWLFTDEETRVEMGRYITTYHREAHMIVDASHMLPMLRDGGTRKFRWEWAPEWNVQPTATRLSLRFIDDGEVARPIDVVPLFAGAPFNSQYNVGREPMNVDIPADVTRVELRAIITGHGASAGTQCAEFCNHQHEFAVNGDWHTREHLEVGDQEGCIAHIENGMTPNQWGTWWFGRGGWCPGEQVDPWVVDVTASVTPGESARVDYHGLFRGAEPVDGDGNIHMASWLVFYR